jgi:hypothetical protein
VNREKKKQKKEKKDSKADACCCVARGESELFLVLCTGPWGAERQEGKGLMKRDQGTNLVSWLDRPLSSIDGAMLVVGRDQVRFGE